MGFAIPIASWLKTDLKEYVDHYINKKRIVSQGIFKWDFIDKLNQISITDEKEYDTKLWYFLMFQMWHEKWMES